MALDKKRGQFTQGNEYWKLAKNAGKPKKYKPTALLKKAYDYAEWCVKYPLYEQKVFSNGTRMKVAKMRAMTIQGFSLFANFHIDTFYEYEKQNDYSEIIKQIRNIFFSQKFEGAAADMLNANIIARELGLNDNQKVEHSGLEIKVTVNDQKTAENLKKLAE
jgi:hypothetical protein